MWDLFWIQIIWHSDSVPKTIFNEKFILKKKSQQPTIHNWSMKNYQACMELCLILNRYPPPPIPKKTKKNIVDEKLQGIAGFPL